MDNEDILELEPEVGKMNSDPDQDSVMGKSVRAHGMCESEWGSMLCRAGMNEYNEDLKVFQERDGQYPKLNLAKISQSYLDWAFKFPMSSFLTCEKKDSP